MQADPSTSRNKDDKIDGEQSAPREKTTPVTPSAAPTMMDVDSAPRSIGQKVEEEEKKFVEPLAQVIVSPPLVPEPKEVVSAKDKARVPEEMRNVEGFPARKIDGSSSSLEPSISEKLRKRNSPLKTIEEDSAMPDDSQTRHMGN